MAHLESYFVQSDQIKNDQAVIGGNEFRHLCKVRRKRVGDVINLTDGEGNFYTARLLQVKATQAVVEIIKRQRLVGEPLVAITLAQGLIRSQRMDWLVEKGTELGVKQFIPLQSEYCQTSTSDLKIVRWQRLAQAAIKQCGRSVEPKIENLCHFAELPDRLSKPVLFAQPDSKNNVIDLLRDIQQQRQDPIRAVSLIIGPEGGFSPTELEHFEYWGYSPVNLGLRRLRSETAAITLIVLTLAALAEL